jgi:hypothetical protein
MTLQELKKHRDALEESIFSGVLSISVDGQTTTFASMDERQRALNRINAEIECLTGAKPRRPRAAQINLQGFI